MEKYKLHFRQSDFPILFTDIILNKKAYGQFNYYIFQEEDNVSAYLDRAGLNEYQNVGKKLLNKSYSEKIKKELISFEKELKEKSKKYKKKKITKQIIISDYQEITRLMEKIGKIYYYCEETVLSVIEKEILKYYSEKNLLQFLEHPKKLIQLKDSKNISYLVNILLDFGKLKFCIHSHFNFLFDFLYKTFKLIARENKISFKQAMMLKKKEIIPALKNGKINVDILNKRLKGGVFVRSKDSERWKFLTGQDYTFWKNKIEKIKNIKEIQGNIAFKGRVKGLVKKHLSLVKGAKIKKNEVIVCGMTNPQIVPFLKNAVAIVTDEGGITCHAAIISRELKKPCIIGTRMATKLLNDGDEVEVNANKGIIKILKKHKGGL